MFTSQGRLLCGLIALGIAIALLLAAQPIGWLFVVQAGLLAYGYVRCGPMVLAFQAYHRSDWERLDNLLSQVWRSSWLRPQDRAYFHFLSGVLASVRGNPAVARQHLAATDATHLRTDHIRCVLECHRAEAALATGDRLAAASHLEAARSMPHRPEAEPELRRLESLLAS